jgi:4-amino-4-deoxy-L-arabinose transferase-like glycosyltransferase
MSDRPKSSARVVRTVLLVLATLVAACFRLVKIDRLPPGESYDPAFYGLDALAILHGQRPIFFETNFGREAMFSYIVAACVAALGVGSPAIHVASAIVGILTVPATYLAAEALYAEEWGLLRRLAAPVAALGLAVSHWHLQWSRFGVRAILTPLCAATTVYLLWRAVQSRRSWAYAACGASLGLAMYTYQASRLLPVLIVLGLVYAVLQRRLSVRQGLAGLGYIAMVAIVVVAPLGAYAVAHPGSLGERIDQVSVFRERTGQSTWATVADGLWRTLLAFSYKGDDNPTTNLPGHPALNPVFAAAFVAGLAVSLFRIRRPAFFLPAAWLGVMCVPGVVAEGSEVAKRAIGSLPAVMMLVATGMIYPVDVLRRWLSTVRGRPSRMGYVMALGGWGFAMAAGMTYSGVTTYREYFITWGQDPALFTHLEAGPAAIGQFAASRPASERIYVSPVHVGHPSIRYNSRERADIKGYHGAYCMLLSYASDRPTTYVVVPGEDRFSLGHLATYLPQAQMVATGPLHGGQPYFLAYRVPARAVTQVEPAHQVAWNWDGQIRLMGYDLATNEAQSGVQVRLYYRALQEMSVDYTASIQLIGPAAPGTADRLLSQADSEPCQRYRPTSSWATDELLVDTVTLSLPQDWVMGERYKLILVLYDWRTMARLPLVGARGKPIADHAVLLEWLARERGVGVSWGSIPSREKKPTPQLTVQRGG